MQLEVTYAEIEKIVNYYFDKKAASWRSKKPIDPVPRKELEENLIISDEKIIKIQKEYLHLGSRIDAVIVVANGGCVLSKDVGEKEDVLNDIYMEFMSISKIELSKKAYSIASGAEILA